MHAIRSGFFRAKFTQFKCDLMMRQVLSTFFSYKSVLYETVVVADGVYFLVPMLS